MDGNLGGTEEKRRVEVEALLERLRAALSRGEGVSRRPGGTYRLQLTADFTFRDAAAVVPYLAALGVTDLYVSPVLEAAPGSRHGYDVVDHGRLSPELGGAEGYEALARAAADHGLGTVVDFVPNHMGVGPQNAWWTELLENGPSSVSAPFFDVDWRPVKAELEHKVLVPILGDQYGAVLERGELTLQREGGTLSLRYFDHRFPIAPRHVPQVLRHRLPELLREVGSEEHHVQELESICSSLEKLAPRHETDADKVAERAREKEVAKRRLAALCDASPRVRAFVDENIAIFNGRPGEPRSFDLLHALLDNQAYRLAFWRVAGEEINYRRFFDINALAAIRMEDPRVFAEAHRVVLGLIRDGKASALRIDHPDGLYAPTAYFRQLQAAHLVEQCRRLAAAGGAELGRETAAALEKRILEELEAGRLPPRPLYVLAEKILSGNERMPESWAIDGTTGYEFVAAATGLFVDGRNAAAFDRLYARFTGRHVDFRDVAAERKRLVMSSSIASELNMLAHRLNRVSEQNRRTRDFTLNELNRALVEFIAQFPVYRTYVNPAGEIDARDRQYVESTLARARRRSPVTDPSIYDFLRDVLLLRYPEYLDDGQKQEWLEFVLKLQQVTGPVTAKALEDTAFYVYNRLVALNEVGGDPREFGFAPAAFHEMCRLRLQRWPGSLNASSTHDTKRSEDVRLRIAALSEIPEEWRARIARWARLNRHHRVQVDGAAAPDRNDELLLYQTLVGAFPEGEAEPGSEAFAAFVSRIAAYMEKAIKESKSHTSWTNPNAEYEAAVKGFVEAILAPGPFLEDLAPFARRIAAAGRLSSLSLAALKCAAPGIPDVYQGCELWDLSLVDPDNRRPVDFGLRQRLLDAMARRLGEGAEARAALAREAGSADGLRDGRAKLLLLREAMHLRREQRELFLEGEHLPLEAEGPHAAHLVAFARRRGRAAVLCVAPRLVLGLLEQGGGRIAWDARVALPPDLRLEWVDAVTGARRRGESLDAAELLGDFPVALLSAAHR